MSLVRLNEGFSDDLEGIAFGMKKEQGDGAIRVVLERDAIDDAMNGNPTQVEAREWFEANRGEIEELAVVKFEKDPTAMEIRITSRDLNPEQWAA
jgi:hypothetical protein